MRLRTCFGTSRVTRQYDEHVRLPHPIHVGVELEYENAGQVLGTRLPVDFNAMWSMGGDGSLRGEGVEFKFHRPYYGHRCVAALDSMQEFLDDVGTDLEVSSRCGTHVHVNVGDLTPAQLNVVAAGYAVLEPYIYAVLNVEREINPFCPPWYHASPSLSTLADLRGRETLGPPETSRWSNVFQKYSGLNLLSVCQFGSVEFRMMLGTRDMSEVEDFVHVCQSIVALPQHFETGEQMLDEAFESPMRLSPAFRGNTRLLSRMLEAEPDRDVLEASWKLAEVVALPPTVDFVALTEFCMNREETIACTIAEVDPMSLYFDEVRALQTENTRPVTDMFEEGHRLQFSRPHHLVVDNDEIPEEREDWYDEDPYADEV